MSRTWRTWGFAILLVSFCAPVNAATVFGTVTGPDGPVAGARVLVGIPNSPEVSSTTNASGGYSIDFDSNFIHWIRPDPPDGQNAWVGEEVSNIEIGDSREIRLFLVKEVTISGRISLPDDLAQLFPTESWRMHRFVRLDKERQGGDCRVEYSQALNFEATCAAGVYAIQVQSPDCIFYQPDALTEQSGCGVADYFSSIAVDARNGSLANIEVPLQNVSSPLLSTSPPIAEKIGIGPADSGGIALVSGEPGSVAGPSRVFITNLQTGHFTTGAAGNDGSFSIPFLAPPGTDLDINHNPNGLDTFIDAFAPGTIVSVPPPGDPISEFAVLLQSQTDHPTHQQRTFIENRGIRDDGQIWLSGTIGSRDFLQEDTIHLEGDIRIFTKNADQVDLTAAQWEIEVALERVFGPDGKQELANPAFASHVLTPTGLPIEHSIFGGGGVHKRDRVFLCCVDIGTLTQSGPHGFAGTWQGDLLIPETLPDGIYSLAFYPNDIDMQSDTPHFNNAYARHFSTMFSTKGATLLRIGNPEPGRLSWALGLNDLSNGARGTIALEDKDRVALASRHATTTHAFIVPRDNPKSGAPRSYRLEPWLPLFGAGNRGWMQPPPISFKYPSGTLTVQVTHPDHSVTALGPSPFTQPYNQQVSSLAVNRLNSGQSPRQYFGLTTFDSEFDFKFTQYGRHEIEMRGSIDDALGNSYEGGGKYEIFIAKQLDLEFGTYPNTPFEVGDFFSPVVIVQPGVAAEIEVVISHYPESDPAKLIEHTMRGSANRFGYFYPVSDDVFVFPSPGEYRVKFTASYLDNNGVLWMGAETWASVVETPDSPLIAHGARPHRDDGTLAQWMLLDEEATEGNHVPFAYQTGDITWMIDDDAGNIHSHFPTITLQDTEGSFIDMILSRYQGTHYFDRWEEKSSIGQIPVLSSMRDGSYEGWPANYFPKSPNTHHGYFYSGSARPGVRIRDMVADAWNEETYWSFNDTYLYQPGNGANGDLPNDFKFEFGGAVYRAADIDFHYYGAYGSLWVLLPDGDPVGTRVMPPFQGNGGGPSGGPIMTLKDKEIDMFLHPMGVRPGSILEVGDVAAFSGQIAPTLETRVWMRITSPGGVIFTVAGTSNKVGYFYDPADNFIVDEPGVWSVKVVTTFEGLSSAGQVTEPFPTGDILGSPNGSYRFYVVDPGDQALQVDIPSRSWVEPGKGPLEIPLLPTDELSDVTVHRTTVMPGFLMEEAETTSTTYTYDAPALHEDFPNLDLVDADSRYGVDTVTMSFLVTGKDGGGNTVQRARQVLLQGEELLAPEQASTFQIKAGHSGAWFYPTTSGQGQFIDIDEQSRFIFMSWFTYTDGASDQPNEQQWYTAQGNYSGNVAELELYESLGGKFDDPMPVNTAKVGSATVSFNHCSAGQMAYKFDDGRVGQFPIQRVIPGSGNTCEERSATAIEAVDINAGMDGSWFDPATAGQGFFIDSYPVPEGGNFIFVSWFTYGDQTVSGQRWLTAQGGFEGSTAEIDVFESIGGSFDDPQQASTVKVGTMSINFTDCANADLSYTLSDGDGIEGDISLVRVVPGADALCEELGESK